MIRISGYSDGVRVLIVGRGPVAQVLATSLAAEHDLTVAVRRRTADHLLLQTARLRFGRPSALPRTRRVGAVAIDDDSRHWDVVISTAPLGEPSVQALLAGPSSAIASVTQVPSEVDVLRELAGARPWGLIVPEFLAEKGEQVAWWCPGRHRFTTAGPAKEMLRSLPASAKLARTATLSKPLRSAATMMPIVAVWQLCGFDTSPTRSQVQRMAAVAAEANAAVAAEFREAPPKPLPARTIRAVLAMLPQLAPMNLPRYLSAHFGSHTPQTVQMLDDWIRLGQENKLSVSELDSLRVELTRNGEQ
ncbi:hypothetical protein [Amycolatopsis taiwanensis]|uniref:hypothetical protein n=1 Tax=Amycolatopsis taiwanensis TaxID=342230 RepID=UPI0012EC8237|nr:hypothetical protein [Amycolatopsis taiwanensis]